MFANIYAGVGDLPCFLTFFSMIPNRTYFSLYCYIYVINYILTPIVHSSGLICKPAVFNYPLFSVSGCQYCGFPSGRMFSGSYTLQKGD